MHPNMHFVWGAFGTIFGAVRVSDEHETHFIETYGPTLFGLELSMKTRIIASEANVVICDGVYDVDDALSFASACADIWAKLADRSAAKSPNVGALYEAVSDNLVPDLRAITLRFEQIDP